MPTEVPLPSKNTKAGICVWEDLSIADVNELNESSTKDDLERKLAKIFNLTSGKEDLKNGVLIDLYYFLFNYCRQQHFNQEQTSALFSIVKKTHEKAIESPFGNVDETFEYFKKLLLCHAVKRPPFSVSIFSVDQVQHITDYILNTYFRHFKLYKYVFTPKVSLNLTIEYKGIPPQTPEVTEEEEAKVAEDTKILESEENVETVSPESPKLEPEESAAVKELKSMISEALSEQLKELRVTMDEQLKESEDTLTKKVSLLGGDEGKATGRSASRTGSRAGSKAKKR